MEEIRNEEVVEETNEMEDEFVDEEDEEVEESKMKKFVSGVKSKVKSVKPTHILKGAAVVAGLVAAYTLGHRSSMENEDVAVAESDYIELTDKTDEPEESTEE